jgi:hypothetical protein
MRNTKRFGDYDSTDEFMSYIRGNMEFDEPTGLYIFPSYGIDTFGLSGPDLVAFVSQCVMRALSEGGIPCIPGYPDHDAGWIYEPKYGTTPKEIHDNVLNEWIANGAGPLEFWTGPWFGLPRDVYPFSEAHAGKR